MEAVEFIRTHERCTACGHPFHKTPCTVEVGPGAVCDCGVLREKLENFGGALVDGASALLKDALGSVLRNWRRPRPK